MKKPVVRKRMNNVRGRPVDGLGNGSPRLNCFSSGQSTGHKTLRYGAQLQRLDERLDERAALEPVAVVAPFAASDGLRQYCCTIFHDAYRAGSLATSKSSGLHPVLLLVRSHLDTPENGLEAGLDLSKRISWRESGLGEYLKGLWLDPAAIAAVHEAKRRNPDFDCKRSFDVRLGAFLKRVFKAPAEGDE